MPPFSSAADVAHVIQLSIAPVFLLTALGTILGVLSARLARIVDRARLLRDRIPGVAAQEQQAMRGELRLLGRRRRLVNLAITFGVAAALLVCLLIAAGFVGSFLRANTSVLIAVLFVLAMVAMVGALLTFLSEILLATRGMAFDER